MQEQGLTSIGSVPLDLRSAVAQDEADLLTNAQLFEYPTRGPMEDFC